MNRISLLALFSFMLIAQPANVAGQFFDSNSEELMQDLLQEGLVVDLRHPIYSDGVLTTTEGGVISAPGLRIQAQSLIYTKTMVDGCLIHRVEASDKLMLEYGAHVFVGESMEFDFETNEGYVYCSRGVITPWYVGGAIIHLTPSGDYVVHDAFLTTSANRDTEWEVQSEKVHINKNSRMRASNVQFRFVNLPLLWIPSWSGNLKTMWRMPIRYHARWSGRLGPRIGLSYQLYGSDEWQALALLDYSFLRGLGGGIETDYQQACGSRTFSTRSYIANDSSVAEPELKERYRFVGVYHDEIAYGFTVDFSYDKLSDRFMATDYDERSFESRAIGRSQLAIRQQTSDWIIGGYVHARLNDFQSVKQELPTLAGSLRPIDLFCSGILSETEARASYLSYRYDKELINVLNYQGTRFHLTERLYRPFSYGPTVFTPEVSLNALHYGDGPGGTSTDQIVTGAGFDLLTDMHRYYGECKHGVTPYFSYRYYAASADPINDHYLFDINDGWTNLQTLRFGCRQSFYSHRCDSVRRRTYLDLYAIAFPQTTTLSNTIPYLNGRLWWYSSDHLRWIGDAAWDTARRSLAFYNLRAEYTFDANLALSLEYRHRSRYAWRKVDYENFFLDAYYTEQTLVDSSLSDPRDVLLTHLYYRFHPTWAIELQSHYGWNRPSEKDYLEYQADLTHWLRAGWQMRLTFQQREDDSRFSIGLGLGAAPPKVPCFETPELAYGNY